METVLATFIGRQEGFAGMPSLGLWNLLEPLGEHPAGSTVSDGTLARHGVAPRATASERILFAHVGWYVEHIDGSRTRTYRSRRVAGIVRCCFGPGWSVREDRVPLLIVPAGQ